jgi:hypothetical protein
MDGGDDRGRGGGPQTPVRSLPNELRDAVHPTDRQGQRPQLLVAGQQAGASDVGAEAGGQGRGGGVENGHVPQLLGPQLGFTSWCLCFRLSANQALVLIENGWLRILIVIYASALCLLACIQ